MQHIGWQFLPFLANEHQQGILPLVRPCHCGTTHTTDVRLLLSPVYFCFTTQGAPLQQQAMLPDHLQQQQQQAQLCRLDSQRHRQPACQSAKQDRVQGGAGHPKQQQQQAQQVEQQRQEQRGVRLALPVVATLARLL